MPTRARRNCSPVNLKYARQREATGQDDKGFAVFPTAEAGWRAAMAQILLDASRGLTLEQYITKFAPPNENDTAAYLRFVVKEQTTDIEPDTRLDLVSDLRVLVDIIEAQAAMEGWWAA